MFATLIHGQTGREVETQELNLGEHEILEDGTNLSGDKTYLLVDGYRYEVNTTDFKAWVARAKEPGRPGSPRP